MHIITTITSYSIGVDKLFLNIISGMDKMFLFVSLMAKYGEEPEVTFALDTTVLEVSNFYITISLLYNTLHFA